MNFKNYFKNNPVNLSDKEVLSIKVGGLITSARLYANLSQADLAKKIHTQQPSIARAENGEVIASLEFLSKIARAIKTDLVIYFGFMENNTKNETYSIEMKSSESYRNTGIISKYYTNDNVGTITSFNEISKK